MSGSDSLSCWACHAEIPDHYLALHGILKSRTARLGGPYVTADCPRCRRTLRCERTLKGRGFISPAGDFSAVDHLFGFFDSELKKRYWEERAWWLQNEQRRRAFFATEGDRRFGRPDAPSDVSEGKPHPSWSSAG